jgi:hypothetical protein
VAAELIDIIEPRNLGTCSRVKLLAAEAIIPMNQAAVKFRANDGKRLGTKA